MSDGEIISREKVELPKHLQTVVARMYDRAVIENTIVEKIRYLSDGLQINGYLTYPTNCDGQRLPLLIWNRGGFRDKGALTDLTAYLILASTAVHGYVVLASQYRGNMGSEGDDDDWGGDDLNDSLNLLHVAENLSDLKIDMDRIAIEGASRGGMTTYRALAVDNRFKCAVVHAGLADIKRLCDYREDFMKLVKLRFDIDDCAERDEKIKRISGIYLAEKFSRSIPILLMHGTADTVVPFEQSELMAATLKECRIRHEFIPIQNGGHVALKDNSYREIDHYRHAWLEKHLATNSN
jgi:dipeptidyl aminopeptidase/acylaminoacyl peptidase